MTGTVALGRPKKNRPEDRPFKPALSIRALPEWTDWVRRCAESLGMPVTTLIEQSLRDYAKRNGFKEPPPKRT